MAAGESSSMSMDWIPVGAELPAVGDYVPVLTSKTDASGVLSERWAEYRGGHFDIEKLQSVVVTHWRRRT